MKKAEIIFVITGFIATFLYLFAIPGMAFVAMASLASLLAIYFYFGFALFNEIRLRNIFWAKNYKHTSKKKIDWRRGCRLGDFTFIIGSVF